VLNGLSKKGERERERKREKERETKPVVIDILVVNIPNSSGQVNMCFAFAFGQAKVFHSPPFLLLLPVL
jgi:hypothetical protein